MDEFEWVNVLVGALSVAFAIWAFFVKGAKDSLDKMSESIREIVDMRLGHISGMMEEIKDDVKAMREDIHGQNVRLTVIETKKDGGQK